MGRTVKWVWSSRSEKRVVVNREDLLDSVRVGVVNGCGQCVGVLTGPWAMGDRKVGVV